MRRTALFLTILAFGAAPKAVVKAPSAVQVGSLVKLDTVGTVSDTPAEIMLWPVGDGDGPEFGPGKSVTGWRLNHAGTYTFFLIASGTPPGQTVVLRDVASTTVQAMPGSKPPVGPGPPVPVSDSLAGAAKIYAAGIPAGFRATAADVRSGKVSTIDGVVAAVNDRRKTAGQPLASEMDKRFKTMADSTGKITDASGIASALESAAAAMEIGPP